VDDRFGFVFTFRDARIIREQAFRTFSDIAQPELAGTNA
jgi:hypothetical protein